MVERARLEIECAPKVYRGFESPPLRVLNFTRTRVKFFLFIRLNLTPQADSRVVFYLTRFVFSFCISNLPASEIVAFFGVNTKVSGFQ